MTKNNLKGSISPHFIHEALQPRSLRARAGVREGYPFVLGSRDADVAPSARGGVAGFDEANPFVLPGRPAQLPHRIVLAPPVNEHNFIGRKCLALNALEERSDARRFIPNRHH